MTLEAPKTSGKSYIFSLEIDGNMEKVSLPLVPRDAPIELLLVLIEESESLAKEISIHESFEGVTPSHPTRPRRMGTRNTVEDPELEVSSESEDFERDEGAYRKAFYRNFGNCLQGELLQKWKECTAQIVNINNH